MTRLVYLPTSVSWPEGVPPPLRWKVGTSPLPTVKSRRTESGRTEVRRFGSGEPDKLEAVWLLTASEYQIFRRFYEGPPWYAEDGVRLDCQLGTVWITADWLWELGYYHHEIRFWSSPRVRRFGAAVEVTATMLIQHEDRIMREWPLWEWTCFPMAARVTHFYSEQLIHGLSTARVTDLYSEQLIHGLAKVRVTHFYSEVLYLPKAKPRVTHFYSEVLREGGAVARTTRFYAEVLFSIPWGGGPGSEGGMFDGICRVASRGVSLLDGRAHILPNQFDGKAVVKDVATDQFDGKATLGTPVVEQFDGQVLVEQAPVNTFDGKAVVVLPVYARITQQYAEVAGKDLSDEARVTQQYAEVAWRPPLNRFDGKVRIKDENTISFDGEVHIKDENTASFDGKAVVE